MSAQELADLESLYADGVLDEDEYKTNLAELTPKKERTRADELADALSAEHYATINRYWSLDASATFAAGYLPQMIAADAMPTAKAARQILAAKRDRHGRLPRDEERITAWNALLLSALVKAAKSGAIRFAKHAHALRQFLHNDSKLLAR